MKRLLTILILFCAITAQAQSPHPATNYLVVAVQDSNGWHVAAFDVDYQLQCGKGTDKLSAKAFPDLKLSINSSSILARNRMDILKLYCNKFLGKKADWNAFPDWDKLGPLTDLKIGMGGNITKIVAALTGKTQ